MLVQRSTAIKNDLLAGLSPAYLKRLLPDFTEIPLAMRKVICAPGETLEYVHFPIDGMLSQVKELADGVCIEVGLIGREGFHGAPVLLGAKTAPVETMVQGQGAALRMNARRFMAHADDNEEFRKLLLRYVQVTHVQIEQTAACNVRHTVNRRLARWLLEAHDRMGRADLQLQHELISMMLGARRPGVTIALGAFKLAGMIGLGHGRVSILDRDRLESAACECYGTVKAETARLLPARKKPRGAAA